MRDLLNDIGSESNYSILNIILDIIPGEESENTNLMKKKFIT